MALTIGIVGLGRVGRRVAALLAPFGCRMLGSDVQTDLQWLAAHRVELVSIEELLQSADLVTLHLPYATGDLHHYFNSARIASMKPGSFLINTSRGGLVEEPAIFEALTSGQLAGAAIDTFEAEPYSGVLIHAPNIILSPHAGSYARSTRQRMELEAVQNMVAALALQS